jgi:hypothetical protein
MSNNVNEFTFSGTLRGPAQVSPTRNGQQADFTLYRDSNNGPQQYRFKTFEPNHIALLQQITAATDLVVMGYFVANQSRKDGKWYMNERVRAIVTADQYNSGNSGFGQAPQQGFAQQGGEPQGFAPQQPPQQPGGFLPQNAAPQGYAQTAPQQQYRQQGYASNAADPAGAYSDPANDNSDPFFSG